MAGSDAEVTMIRRRSIWLRRIAVVSLLSVLLGLFQTGQAWIKSLQFGGSFHFVRIAFESILTWLALGALALPVLALTERVPLRRERLARALPIHAAAGILFAVAYSFLSAVMFFLLAAPERSFAFYWSKNFVINGLYVFLIYWAIVGVAGTVRLQREVRERDLAAARLQASLNEARLEAVRAKIHPHFLFNTLNAVSTLALRGERDKVSEMISRLSDLLRAALDDSMPQKIPLQRELAITRDYLDILLLRFGDRLKIELSVEAEVERALVPNLILQPLVENAVIHGIAAVAGEGSIVISASETDGRLHLAVSDSGPGFDEQAEHGVGLGTTEARLRALYGSSASIRSVPGRGRVEVELPLEWPDGD